MCTVLHTVTHNRMLTGFGPFIKGTVDSLKKREDLARFPNGRPGCEARDIGKHSFARNKRRKWGWWDSEKVIWLLRRRCPTVEKQRGCLHGSVQEQVRQRFRVVVAVSATFSRRESLHFVLGTSPSLFQHSISNVSWEQRTDYGIRLYRIGHYLEISPLYEDIVHDKDNGNHTKGNSNNSRKNLRGIVIVRGFELVTWVNVLSEERKSNSFLSVSAKCNSGTTRGEDLPWNTGNDPESHLSMDV